MSDSNKLDTVETTNQVTVRIPLETILANLEACEEITLPKGKPIDRTYQYGPDALEIVWKQDLSGAVPF